MGPVRYIIFLMVFVASQSPLNAQEAITLTIRGVIERQALYFPAKSDTGVVLVHQSGYDAASWTGFARKLQEVNITSIALGSTSSEDVFAGIDFLRSLGIGHITLIGASIGGGSVQDAANKSKPGTISQIVLLGTAQGSMNEITGVNKLFVVTKNDFFASRTHASYRSAADPKRLLIFPGSAHGQDMLKEAYGPELIGVIVDAIRR